MNPATLGTMSYTVHEHRVTVPLDHHAHTRTAAKALGLPETITVFAREIVPPGGENLPCLLYLQGGPGCPAPRPGTAAPAWLDVALRHYRVILLDQRGTGCSTPVDTSTLSLLPDETARARLLSLLRADQIVADAEAVRAVVSHGRPWASLGQSFGGFITLAYLSRHPEGLERCFITGGLPGLTDIDTIYRETYRLTATRCRTVYRENPRFSAWVREIAAHLAREEERLPDGSLLTPQRFRHIGIGLGTTSGTAQLLECAAEEPFIEFAGGKKLTQRCLAELWKQLSYAETPLYAALHETIYAAATPDLAGKATAWAAYRLLSEVDEGFACEADPSDGEYLLYGEHMMPTLFLDDPALQPFAGAAQQLAERADWPVLYDVAALADIGADVPIHACAYEEDMFVPFALSRETANHLGADVTISKLLHDGLRQAGSGVLEGLFARAGIE